MQRRHREHQCVLWLVYRVPVGDKIIEQALGWTEGPTHVYQGGMFEAATLQLLQNTVLSNGHSVWAESVGKECYCTVCGLVLDPAWQLREFGRNQAIQKRSVVWVKCNAADTFKNARYVSLRKEPKKKKERKKRNTTVHHCCWDHLSIFVTSRSKGGFCPSTVPLNFIHHNATWKEIWKL